MLIDIHAHLDHKWFEKDLDKVVNVENLTIIATGIDPESNRKALEFAKKYKNIKCTLGIYPKEAFDYEKEDQELISYQDFEINKELDWIEEQVKEDKKRKEEDKEELIFGIGEIGLDFVNIKDDEDKLSNDIDLFKKQLSLAKKYNLPVVIHSRKAEKEVIDILEEEFKEEKQKKVILHAFGGSKKLVKRAIELGYTFSIPPVVVRASHFQMIIKETPISQLLTETDAPYLGVEREERNDPENVKFAIEKIAEIKELSKEEVEKVIYENYLALID